MTSVYNTVSGSGRNNKNNKNNVSSSNSNNNDNDNSSTSQSPNASSWMTVHKLSTEDAKKASQVTSTVTSEFRLRMECYQQFERQLEAAEHHAWTRLLRMEGKPQPQQQRRRQQEQHQQEGQSIICSSSSPSSSASHSALSSIKQHTHVGCHPHPTSTSETTTSSKISTENIIDDEERVDNHTDGVVGGGLFHEFCIDASLPPSSPSPPSRSTSSASQSASITETMWCPNIVDEVLPVIHIYSPLCETSIIDRHSLAGILCDELRRPVASSPLHDGGDRYDATPVAMMKYYETHNATTAATVTTAIVVHIPHIMSTLQHTLHVIWDGILKQTQQQQHLHHQNQWYSYWQRRTRKRKRMTQSIGDLIIEYWHTSTMTTATDFPANQSASASMSVPLVLVVEQRPQFHSQQLWKSFLDTMARWRTYHGIPVSIILVDGSHGIWSVGSGGRDHWMMGGAGSGRFGPIRSIYISIPPSSSSSSSLSSLVSYEEAAATWLNFFLERLHNMPIPPLCLDQGTSNASMSISRIINTLIQDHFGNPQHRSSSCSAFVSNLRMQVLQNFYAKFPGSFVWDALGETTMTRNSSTEILYSQDKRSLSVIQPSFCAWFCSYEKAKRLLSASSSSPSSGSSAHKLILCRRIQSGPLRFWWNIVYIILPLQVLAKNQSEVSVTKQSSTVLPRWLSDSSSLWWTALARAFHQTKSFVKYGTAESSESKESTHPHSEFDLHLSGVVSADKCFDNPIDKILRGHLQKHCRNDDLDSISTSTSQEAEYLSEKQARLRITGMIRELIVLSNQATSARTCLDGLYQMIDDVSNFSLNRIQYYSEQWASTNLMMRLTNATSTSPFNISIRQQVVSTLSPSTKLLFDILDERLSIPSQEWYRIFSTMFLRYQHVNGRSDENSSTGLETAMVAFMDGVYTLQKCGLVQGKEQLQRRNSSRLDGSDPESYIGQRQVVFEKIPVVLC